MMAQIPDLTQSRFSGIKESWLSGAVERCQKADPTFPRVTSSTAISRIRRCTLSAFSIVVDPAPPAPGPSTHALISDVAVRCRYRSVIVDPWLVVS